jgi:metallo-beta-lactamase family protein
MITVTCLGAAGSVTGSNYLVETSRGTKVLVDCGLFQGGKQMELRNWEAWGYEPKEIHSLILTHAHIDHSGRIPKLVKDGFRGRVITSPPTAELCGVMLLDSAHVQEMEAEWQTRKNRRKNARDIEPLYTTKEAEESLKYLNPIELDQIIGIAPGIKVCLRNAGHILGSSIAELWVEDDGAAIKIVFSGDLGRRDPLIVQDASAIGEADYLFLESTYGNRLHRPFEESKEELLTAIQHAVSHHEKVIIPAFALERTQEVLYLLGEFFRAGKLPDIPVYLDSPLAIKATEIFRKNKKYYDAGARAIVERGFDPFSMPNLKLTPTVEESIQINKQTGSAIVISANGMCTAGRIKHHLKHNLWRAGASIIFVGFQAQGTTGRQIVDGAKAVTIFGEKVAVRAKVFTIGGFSAHGDQNDLIAWVEHFTRQSKPIIFAIHGEAASSEALASAIKKRFGLDVYIPRWRELLRLPPRGGKFEIVPPAVAVDHRKDMFALIGELEQEITHIKERVVTNKKKIQETDVDKLRDVRDELQALGE